MSKTLHATCEGNVVTADGVPVASARVLSKGIGASVGVLVLDEDRADYLPSTASDLEETLTSVISALQAAASGLSGASSALTTVGGAAGVPGPALTLLTDPIDDAASDVGSVTTALEELKARLK